MARNAYGDKPSEYRRTCDTHPDRTATSAPWSIDRAGTRTERQACDPCASDREREARARMADGHDKAFGSGRYSS